MTATRSLSRLLCTALLLCTVGWAGPSLAADEQSIQVLVNDEPITSYDVNQRVKFMVLTAHAPQNQQTREKAIEELITERIQMQEAKKGGIIIDEGQVDEIINGIAKRNKLTGEQLAQAFKQRDVNIKTLRDRIKAAIAWRNVVKQKFRYQVVVGDSDVEKAMANATDEENSTTAEKGKEKTEFQLQRVQLALGSDRDQRSIAARLSEAELLRSRFNACSSLPILMKNVRDGTMQDVGRRAADEIPQPTRALLLAASEGQMTPPVITASGVELYAVCGRQTVRAKTEERKEVHAKLVDEEYQRLARGYLSDLRASAFVDRRDKKN